MKLYMFFEEKRTDDKQNEFYICRLFSTPCVSEQPVSVGDEFFYLYDEKENDPCCQSRTPKQGRFY